MRLFCGDCLEVMATLPDGCVDIVITSPPYNVGLAYNSYDDRQAGEAHVAFVSQVMAETARLLSEGGRAYWVVSDQMLFWLRGVGEQVGLTFAQVLVWCKPNIAGGGSKITGDWSHLSEWILLFRKGKRTPMQRGRDVTTHSYFVIPSPQRNWKKEPKEHPAQFPVELPRRLITRTPGQVVFDPLMGSGSVGVAALLEGRDFLGIEKDPDYFAIAERRVTETVRSLFVAAD